VPGEAPVVPERTPNGSTEPTPELLHVPAGVALESWDVRPEHIALLPVIVAGNGFTVTVNESLHGPAV
jgi:hypothetical protein